MSSPLLEECMAQFEQYDFSPEFHAYLARQKPHLLGSGDVAAGLVFLITQDSGDSEYASQMLSMLLDEARAAQENDSAGAGNFLEAMEEMIQFSLASGELEHAQLAILAALYRRAGLSVPQCLMLDPGGMPPHPDMEQSDVMKGLENVAQEVLSQGGTALDLFGVIDEMLATIPEEPRSALARHIATMDAPAFERCALYMLLSDSEPVQRAIVTGLHQRLASVSLSSDTMLLLPMMRGWFAEGSTRTALDALLKEARRKAVPTQTAADTASIQKIVSSTTDGVGAQTIAILLTRGAQTSVAMILLKAGYGIKDAFIMPPGDDAEQVIGLLSEQVEVVEITYATLQSLLEGALHDGLDHDCLPAPGILDIIEACHLSALRPQQVNLDTLFDLADPERMIRDGSPQGLGRWINDSVALDCMSHLTESWFEDNREIREIMASGRTRHGTEAAIWNFLESRREPWARRFLQAATLLRDDQRTREWKTLTASAHGLVSGRALKRIPLMKDIMQITIEVAIENLNTFR